MCALGWPCPIFAGKPNLERGSIVSSPTCVAIGVRICGVLARGDDAAVRVPDESPKTDPATGLEADEHRAFLHRQVEALPVAVGMAGCHPPNTIAISISNRAGCATSGVVGGWRWREVWRWRAERVYWRR